MADNTMHAQSFIEAMENDTSLQTQFAIASPNTLDGVVDFAASKGYIFSEQELDSALKHSPNSRITEQLRQYVH